MNASSLRLGWHDPAHPDSAGVRGPQVTAAQVMGTEAMLKAAAHLAIETGDERARASVARMTELLDSAAAAAGASTAVEVHTSNQSTAPPPWDTARGIGLELRGIRDRRIVWDIAVYAPIIGSDSILWHPVAGDRTAISDTTGMRGVIAEATRRERRRIAEARKLTEARAAEYARSLTGPAAALQATARPQCVQVSPDGLSVTEAFHDVSGSATWTAGANGFEVPASLADWQRRHDNVYHPAKR